MSPRKCVADAFPEILIQWTDSADPEKISIGSGKEIEWTCSKGHVWKKPPAQRFRNGRASECPTCKKGPPISETHPEVLLDWNDSNVNPNEVTYGAATEINWRCHDCEHEWVASPNARIKKGIVKQCPVCSVGSLHSSGINSLETLNPELASEWNYELNHPRNPSEFTLGSAFVAWWKCNTCENEWQTSISNRVGLNTGCPTCNIGRLHSDKRNSLQSLNPNLASQWHPTKNGELSPDDVVPNYAKKVWWYCDKSECEHPHEWKVSPNARTSHDSGCPFCAGNQASFCPCDSIANTNPELAAELHPDEKIKPTELTEFSLKKVRWLCKKSTCEHEHSWYSAVNNRTAGNGCPYCAGKIACRCNSFGSVFPEWVSMWSEKNKDNSPFDYTPHSSKFAWWQCPVAEDHIWRGRISDRTRKDQMGGCPFCAGKKLSITNCLANTHPEYEEQWHPTKNGELLPSMVTNGTNRRVWWKCHEGPDHEWSTTVSSRISGKTQCPFCIGQRVSVTNCLANTKPNVAKDWHPTKNQKKTPFDFTSGSNRQVWWKCGSCEGEWRSAISNRTAGRGCPSCAETGFNPGKPAYFYAMEIIGTDGLWWYKGGISHNPEQRRYQIENSIRKAGMHLDVRLIQSIHFELGRDAKELESKLLQIDEIRASTIEKFDGNKELFSVNPIEYAQQKNIANTSKSKQLTIESFCD